MKIEGGVGFAYTSSEEWVWTLIETLISFADAKGILERPKDFQGVGVAFAIGN